MTKRKVDVMVTRDGEERRVKRPGGATAPVDWSKVDPILVTDTIATVAATGGALRFGYTRDGGAYSVGVYGDGTPYTLYCSPHEDVRELLGSISDGFRVGAAKNGDPFD